MDIMGFGFAWGEFCHNYPDFTFEEFPQTFCKHYYKAQMDEQVYMSLKNIK
jgi:hypothetical protein